MGCGRCWCFSPIMKLGMAVIKGRRRVVKAQLIKDAGILKFVIFDRKSNKSKNDGTLVMTMLVVAALKELEALAVQLHVMVRSGCVVGDGARPDGVIPQGLLGVACEVPSTCRGC